MITYTVTIRLRVQVQTEDVDRLKRLRRRIHALERERSVHLLRIDWDPREPGLESWKQGMIP